MIIQIRKMLYTIQMMAQVIVTDNIEVMTMSHVSTCSTGNRVPLDNNITSFYSGYRCPGSLVSEHNFELLLLPLTLLVKTGSQYENFLLGINLSSSTSRLRGA